MTKSELIRLVADLGIGSTGMRGVCKDNCFYTELLWFGYRNGVWGTYVIYSIPYDKELTELYARLLSFDSFNLNNDVMVRKIKK